MASISSWMKRYILVLYLALEGGFLAIGNEHNDCICTSHPSLCRSWTFEPRRWKEVRPLSGTEECSECHTGVGGRDFTDRPSKPVINTSFYDSKWTDL